MKPMKTGDGNAAQKGADSTAILATPDKFDYHLAKAYDGNVESLPMLPDNILPYQLKAEVTMQWAMQFFAKYAVMILKIGKDVINQDIEGFKIQFKDKLQRMLNFILDQIRKFIKEKLTGVLHSRNITFTGFNDYQTFTKEVFNAIFKENGRKLPDGSSTTNTLEDDKLLYTYVMVRDCIDVQAVRAFGYKTLNEIYGFRVDEISQKNFINQIAVRHVKDTKRKLECATHNAISQHFSCSGKDDPPIEFHTKWPYADKKDVSVTHLGKSIKGTLFLGGPGKDDKTKKSPGKKSRSSPRKKKSPKKQKEIGESNAKSSTPQKEDPNQLEDGGADAALELEKVSFVSINVNTNQITLTTVILLFRGGAM